jgi:hypothetical protein
MTTGGWAIMILSLVGVWGLALWCSYTVLTAPPEDHVVEPPASLGG